MTTAKTFFKDYRVAAFSNSSNTMIRKIIKKIPDNLDLIIEQGAGDGIMTKALLPKLNPSGRLIVIEQNKDFVQKLQEIRDSRIQIFEGFVQEFEYDEYLREDEKADLIISSIPFSFLPNSDKDEIVNQAYRYTKESGKLIIFHQYSILMRKYMKHYFCKCSTKFIMRNLPPCFFLIGEK